MRKHAFMPIAAMPKLREMFANVYFLQTTASKPQVSCEENIPTLVNIQKTGNKLLYVLQEFGCPVADCAEQNSQITPILFVNVKLSTQKKVYLASLQATHKPTHRN